jgi:hypothetical protein
MNISMRTGALAVGTVVAGGVLGAGIGVKDSYNSNTIGAFLGAMTGVAGGYGAFKGVSALHGHVGAGALVGIGAAAAAAALVAGRTTFDAVHPGTILHRHHHEPGHTHSWPLR